MFFVVALVIAAIADGVATRDQAAGDRLFYVVLAFLGSAVHAAGSVVAFAIAMQRGLHRGWPIVVAFVPGALALAAIPVVYRL